MANKTADANVRCPFYLREEGKTISCEGMMPDTCMITKFKCAADKLRHMKTHCRCVDGGACFMAKSLYGKYGQT